MEKVFFGLCILFLLVFPKGGLKFQGIPITIGYLLFTLAFLAILVRRAIALDISISRPAFIIFCSMIPFQGYAILHVMYVGNRNPQAFISLIVSLVLLPIACILLLSWYFDRADIRFLLRWIKNGVLTIACYGIFLFIFKQPKLIKCFNHQINTLVIFKP